MSELSLGEMIDAMQSNREERRCLESQTKELKSAYDDMERGILVKLNELNISNARGGAASASLKESVVPTVKDRDAFLNYIRETDSLHLLTCAPSTPACRELWQSGEVIPGVESFNRQSLNLRTL
jgi:hypothetical protein